MYCWWCSFSCGCWCFLPNIEPGSVCVPPTHKSADMSYYCIKLHSTLEQYTCWLPATATCRQSPRAYNFRKSCCREEEWDGRKEGVVAKTLLDKNRQAPLTDTLQKSCWCLFCVVGPGPGSFNVYNEKQKRKQNSLSGNMINSAFLEWVRYLV